MPAVPPGNTFSDVDPVTSVQVRIDFEDESLVRPGTRNPIADLFPAKSDFITPESDARGLELLGRLNRNYSARRSGDSRLDARIRSYELAARMQLSAPEALDISREPEDVLELYGLAHGQKSFAPLELVLSPM